MRPRKTLTLISLFTLFSVGLYAVRRRLMQRLLHLRPARYGVAIRRNVRISMPDGVELAADLYQPRSKRLFPTVLIRTPYSRGLAGGVAGWISAFAGERFAERGYNVLVQDVRGRYGSDGEWNPFRHEAEDGRATLAWIEAQPWFNGQVGMWGPSYLGYVQWVLAPGAPLYLKAIVPIHTGARLPVVGLRDGALAAELQLRWLEALENTPSRLSMLRVLELWPWRTKEAELTPYPFNEADRRMLGYTVDYFQDWMAHPDTNDDYWQAVNPTPRLGQINAAAHLIGGWYDILIRETVEDYTALVEAGRRPYLTIGPWTHSEQPMLLESLRQSLVWFDAHLKGDRRALRSNPVRVFVMGANQWLDLPAWPPESQAQPWRLQPGRALAAPDAEPAPDAPPDSYTCDPYRPTPALGGNTYSANSGRVDNRPLEARPDVLTYTSQPLAQPLTVIGAGRLALCLGSDREYTDVFIRLCDVYPDGASYNICDGFLRICPDNASPDADGLLRIDVPLWPTAHQFAAGHRLRLVIAGAAFPRWSRNPGTCTPLTEITTLLPVCHSIYHDAAHPTTLWLPEAVLPADALPATRRRFGAR